MSTPTITPDPESAGAASPALATPTPAQATPSTPAGFIASCLPAATLVKQTYKVPIAALIAQAALESGWGQHVVQFAYFGIKGRAPSGSTVNFATTEVINGQVIHETLAFRSYTSFADAADDYGRFLSTNERYAGCFQYTNDPINFIRKLAAAGYATAPNYAAELIAIMTHHNLPAYDAQ